MATELDARSIRYQLIHDGVFAHVATLDRRVSGRLAYVKQTPTRRDGLWLYRAGGASDVVPGSAAPCSGAFVTGVSGYPYIRTVCQTVLGLSVFIRLCLDAQLRPGGRELRYVTARMFRGTSAGSL